MPTPHIAAKDDDFAKVVLMPGDPLRAQYIAENFLIDPVLVSSVRGILAYTGTTKQGVRVSVMASGMGMPSIGIYAFELYTHYKVETIIRIGTAGAYLKEAKVKSLVLAQGASTNSSWASQFDLKGGSYAALASYELLKKADEIATRKKLDVVVGNILSSDIFYDADPNYYKKWAALNILAVEMEAYALYATAAYLKKKALAILTITDHFLTNEHLGATDRQTGLKTMIELALELASTL
jgi:purine-nucleoside phosphorylase